jgi:DNA-directed RNA polymerase II subunit RPB4
MNLHAFCSVYNKTLEYVKTFTKFNTTDSASAVRECVALGFSSLVLLSYPFLLRTLRRESALTQFETAQIANLCPADADEAKSVIPRQLIIFLFVFCILTIFYSLVKIDDDKLQLLLDEIQTMRKFQS